MRGRGIVAGVVLWTLAVGGYGAMKHARVEIFPWVAFPSFGTTVDRDDPAVPALSLRLEMLVDGSIETFPFRPDGVHRSTAGQLEGNLAARLIDGRAFEEATVEWVEERHSRDGNQCLVAISVVGDTGRVSRSFEVGRPC